MADVVNAQLHKTRGQTIIYMWLFLTFLILVGTSTTLFHYLVRFLYLLSNENRPSHPSPPRAHHD